MPTSPGQDSTPAQGCDCISRLNAGLADENTVLDTVIWMDLDTQARRLTVRMPVLKRDPRSRKRPVPVAPIFCPFCGTRYPVAAETGGAL
jgi:hypothetical protein